MTVNGSALLNPPDDNQTLPVVAPAGTGTAMVVEDHVAGVARVPKVTVLSPCAAPRLVPMRVTEVPVDPLASERLVSVGVGGVPVAVSREGTGLPSRKD